MSVRFKILVSIALGCMLNQTVGFDGNPNHNCAHLNFQCDPITFQPCCDGNNICEEISKDAFRCVFNNKELLQLGDICKSDVQCDHILHAKCSNDNKTCVCRPNNIQIKKKCVPLLNSFCWKNEECATSNSSCINNTCTCKTNYVKNSRGECMLIVLGRGCEDDTQCSEIKFATCSENKICTCSPNTTQVNQIRCIPVLNGFCWQDNDCFTTHSKCINNKCQCKSGFSPTSDMKCVSSYLGAHCQTNRQCSYGVNHSYCSYQEKRCSCKKDYYPSNGRCGPKINVSCSYTDRCSVKESICINNICQCKPQYKYENFQCFPTYLGERCDNNYDCIKIKHSECSIDKSCVCEDNYGSVNETTCGALISGFCSTNEQCTVPHSICINNKCQCTPGYSAEMNNTVCALFLNSNCLNDEQCWPDHSVCIDNRCECDSETVQISDNKCAVPLGFACSTGEDCQYIANGECSEENICDCKENYNQLNETACNPLLGGRCLTDAECTVGNSHCVDNKCQCKLNFLPFLNEQCLGLNLNQLCNYDNDCREIQNAECSQDKKCVCRHRYKAFGHSKCLSLIGEFCTKNDDCFSHKSVACIDRKCQCPKEFRALPSKDQCTTAKLGILCETDEDCVLITNAQCSEDKICVCKNNHFALNTYSCAPFLNETCSVNNTCMVDNSICVNNMCQCQPEFSPVSHNKCVSNALLFSCDKDSDCGDPWHSKCSEDKKCICNIRNHSLDKSTCLPLIGGYCWVNHQCFIENSSCIDYHCQCNIDFIAASINLCVAANATLFTDRK